MAIPRVSVAMATFNGERFLGAQLQSIARQTLKPFELVIGDDGSTDSTLAIVEGFRRKAPFEVRVQCNDLRRGFADNFLATASRCYGDAIAFCDQDDVWVEHKIERCALEMTDESVQLVMHSGRVVDSELRATGGLFPQIARDGRHGPLEVDPWAPASGFALVFRASMPFLFTAPRRPVAAIGTNEPMLHDRWVWFLASVFGDIVTLREPLTLYRRHTQTVTTPFSKQPFEGLRQSWSAGSAQYDAQATFAADRAELLLQMAQAAEGHVRERCEKAAIYYRCVQRRLGMRARLYADAHSVGRRARGLGQLVAAGAYRRRSHGGLGARALAKDILVAVLGSPCSPGPL